LGIGDWGLGIGGWAQPPIPNPQSPLFLIYDLMNNIYNYFLIKIIKKIDLNYYIYYMLIIDIIKK